MKTCTGRSANAVSIISSKTWAGRMWAIQRNAVRCGGWRPIWAVGSEVRKTCPAVIASNDAVSRPAGAGGGRAADQQHGAVVSR